MSDYLVDTSFLIAFFNETATDTMGPARKFHESMPRAGRLYASLVSLAELLEGTDEPRIVETELRALVGILSIGDQVARKTALIQRKAKQAGRKMGENDAWIAATAMLADLTLVGRDARGFEDRAGLRYVAFDR